MCVNFLTVEFRLVQFAVMYWWIIGATSGPLRLLVRQVKSVKNPNHSMTSCLARDVVLSNISITSIKKWLLKFS